MCQEISWYTYLACQTSWSKSRQIDCNELITISLLWPLVFSFIARFSKILNKHFDLSLTSDTITPVWHHSTDILKLCTWFQQHQWRTHDHTPIQAWPYSLQHSDVIMRAMATQITVVSVVYPAGFFQVQITHLTRFERTNLQWYSWRKIIWFFFGGRGGGGGN